MSAREIKWNLLNLDPGEEGELVNDPLAKTSDSFTEMLKVVYK